MLAPISLQLLFSVAIFVFYEISGLLGRRRSGINSVTKGLHYVKYTFNATAECGWNYEKSVEEVGIWVSNQARIFDIITSLIITIFHVF